MANSSKTIKFLPLVTQNETPIEVKGQQLPPENNIQKSQVCRIQHLLLVVAGGFLCEFSKMFLNIISKCKLLPQTCKHAVVLLHFV